MHQDQVFLGEHEHRLVEVVEDGDLPCSKTQIIIMRLAKEL